MTKQFLFVLFISSLLFSCAKEAKNQMLVQGEITYLKKGTIYLEKIKEGVLSVVDSLPVEGTGKFQFSTSVESAEVYFLSLDREAEKTIPFFGEKGSITINTSLNKFVHSAKISGSKNQEILDNYNEIAAKFKNQNLDLIKENFEAQKAQDQEKLAAVLQKSNNLIRRNYLYTTNFAINNADSEVAPYLALTKLANANIKLLDTINKSLSEEIKKSRYGKELNSYIEKIKASEKE
ncbi:DUF4369 domain-containing protein [Flavicella sediminum]|uniref:DUF4369 domain-containing protein n=1 Tax=Flavicella sediminum TaxID=2585141 RepID=UPI00112487A6|nr:DUF4369 domain-containing protein [Flavicella sediminum]